MNAHAFATIRSAAHAPSLGLLEARAARDDLRALLGAERSAAAEFLLALSGFDARRGWEPLGHASLFAFLVAELRLSRSAAFWRLSAARLLQRFPEVIEPLRDGRLCVSTTAELSKVVTPENLAGVLPRYYGLSAREAAEVTAALQPRLEPPLRTTVTQLAAACRRPEASRGAGGELEAGHQPPVIADEAATRTQGSVQTFGLAAPPPFSPSPVPRMEVEPLSADLRRLHVTVSDRLLKKIDTARDGLSHALPHATTEQVLEAALDLLLAKQDKARGLVKKPRTTAAPTDAATVRADAAIEPAPVQHRRSGPRGAIPAAVKRAVWARDGGRCSWPLDGGGTCGSTHRLQLDHVFPWARGGEATVANLRLTCARHNATAARATIGAGVADRYAADAGRG